jgi:hypothetical protein
VFEWLRSILGGKAGRAPKSASPTEAEMQVAVDCLDRMVKPAIFGELGGPTPSHVLQPGSWWGGNFFGVMGEMAPICKGTGQPMRPLAQIRMDELPEVPACFEGLALLNIWVDLKAIFADYEADGAGFVIRTYPTLDGLVPVDVGPADRKSLPAFPILWRGPGLDQPHWEDMADKIPASVAESDEDVWFFESRYAVEAETLTKTCPVKLGGWPNWIQSPQWPEDAEFCLQVDSTDKGKLNIGDGGSLYIFRTRHGWASRSDCY